jgi:hypothetical protein
MTWALLLAAPALGLTGLVFLLRPGTLSESLEQHTQPVKSTVISLPKTPVTTQAPAK